MLDAIPCIRKTKMEKTRKTFAEWSEQQLRQTFGLRFEKECLVLQSWIEEGLKSSTPESEKGRIEYLRAELEQHGRGWNEEELKLFFIGPLLSLARIEGDNFATFAGRTLTAELDDYILTGVVDGLVARGELEPVTPYFCLHEYKGEESKSSSAAGQVLAAMLATRTLNETDQDVYGAYVLGRLWFFMVLEGSEQSYGLSRAFDAASEDIFEIYGILHELKRRIAEMIGE